MDQSQLGTPDPMVFQSNERLKFLAEEFEISKRKALRKVSFSDVELPLP